MSLTPSLPVSVDALMHLPDGERCRLLSELLDRCPASLDETAESLGLVPLSLEQCQQAEEEFSRISLADALAQGVLPLRQGDQHWLALSNPFSLPLRQWLQRIDALPALAPISWLNVRLAALGKQQRTLDQLQQQSEEDKEITWLEITPAAITSEPNAVIKLVNATLFDALQSRASDIHLSAVADGLTVKYRIDGVLHTIRHCAGLQHAEQVISRLKVLSCMDISERRIPQDGRFKAQILQRAVDFRVSVMPSIHGEDAVLRVLDKSLDQSLRLETLGFDAHTLGAIRQLAQLPHGMVLVTGPTGSGKSTTLYSALSELNNGEKKIITIEDPVEYQLNGGVLQIPVNDKKGLTFARGLRAILRHDPDIILVGEIRDGETAGIAVQAALTGHTVLSSVHANDVFSVLERFLYMQVEPASLITALNGVVAQRLIRQICPDCRKQAKPSESALNAWQSSSFRHLTPDWHIGTGCDACRHSGYRDRLALAEVLHCSDAIKEAMLARAPVRKLRDIALEEGFIPLPTIALRAVLEGKTSWEEVNRVIAH
ncbi:GspE/PulE family protein [Mixta mediterraneensis]|uniref:GspE/PulE family protein n=1 Tax=Mixta mediterraneensis TaxID=2758443 RepID=UPI0018745700|nr:GspE/PulE family protein [Mixta mediterraneensis]MBE5254500.1 type II/IV secretion system protein [Mixta mediterraneensis]